MSLRASQCAVCDAPAPVNRRAIQSGEIASGEWVRFQRPPEEMQELYGELVKTLAPNIRVLGMAGEGGMAYVFVARDSVLRREVAVKMLSPKLADDETARKRFTREAQSIAAVQHPNIVNVYHVGEIPGRAIPYFVMQFVDGPTLGMGALRGRQLTEVRVRRLMTDVAAGLAAAHRRKVYHRDIKPNNIVLDGETGRAMVLDFGISAASSSRRRKSLGTKLTEEGMYLGTPTYMSPEQAGAENVTGKSDVYSLGVLAFEVLVGHPPFEGSPLQIVASHMNNTPPRVDELRSDVSEELATLIARCLEKNPARRPSAEEIVHFLSPAEKGTVEWPPPGMTRVRGVGARLLASLTGTAFASVIFFGMVGFWPDLALLRTPADGLARSFGLGAGLAIIFALATMVIFYGLIALGRWRWAVKTGYPSWVVADVLCDTKRDGGHLINGTADFAFVSGAERHTLRSFRRGRLVVQILAAFVALAGVAHWITVWLAAGGSHAPQPVALIWAIPLVVLFLIYLILGIPEWRVHRRERMPVARRSSGESAPPLRGELVKMWMASAERARKSLTEDVTK